jgi:hypothetical protein
MAKPAWRLSSARSKLSFQYDLFKKVGRDLGCHEEEGRRQVEGLAHTIVAFSEGNVLAVAWKDAVVGECV